ncbi:glycosyltransferase family 4 protein [soil metagenome]
MKLLVVSHSCATAANQRLYAELKLLTGWDVTLIIPAHWKDEFGNRLDEPPVPGLRVIKVPVFANGNIIFHFYRLNWSRFLQEESFDAIYVNHEPYGLATAQICRANLRLRHPAAFSFYSCQNIVKHYPFPFSKFEGMVYRHSSLAFPITQAVADVLSAKGFKGTQSICGLPLDPARYRPLGREADLAQIPRQEGEAVIGYVGRIVESKGLRTFAQALGQISALPWKLVVIGTGNFETEFRELLKARHLTDRVTFLGYVPHDETPRYLSAFDMLVLPSETQPNWKEQFGRVITESFACGTPVIGSDSGEIPILIRLGEGGLIFPERNATEFAEALGTLIRDSGLRQQCGESGMKWTAENLSLRAIARTMADAFSREA